MLRTPQTRSRPGCRTSLGFSKENQMICVLHRSRFPPLLLEVKGTYCSALTWPARL